MNKGFSLIEVLAALLILSVAFISLFELHGLATKKLRCSQSLLEGICRLDAHLRGEPQKGVKIEVSQAEVLGKPVKKIRYSLSVEGEDVVFYRYAPK